MVPSIQTLLRRLRGLLPRGGTQVEPAVRATSLLDHTFDILGTRPATRSIRQRLEAIGFDRTFGERVCHLVLEMGDHDMQRYDAAVEDFIALCREYGDLQRDLEKTGHYKYRSHADVKREVLDDPKRMSTLYLHGLLFSQIFWAAHYQIFQYFCDTFCTTGLTNGRVLEVPAGTGIFLSEFVARNPTWQADGVDLSASSIAFSQRLGDHWTPGRSASFRLGDVYDIPATSAYDRVICGELLEHLEQPEHLLQKLVGLIKPDGAVFVTTVSWAAYIDHIYLFDSADSIRTMIRKYFTVERELVLSINPGGDPEVPGTPLNYAAVLRPLLPAYGR